MISVIYFVIGIILSLIFSSWDIFLFFVIFWILWMTFRFIARNGVVSDSDWWMFYDVEDSVNDFGGGSFGGGGAGDSWDSSDSDSGSSCGGSSCGGGGGD